MVASDPTVSRAVDALAADAPAALLLARIPAQVWTPAYDADGQVRDGAWVAELTGLLDLTGWPPGMRVIGPQGTPAPGCPAADHSTSTSCGSPFSPPTLPADSYPTSSCGTAAEPGPRTASAARKTPG